MGLFGGKKEEGVLAKYSVIYLGGIPAYPTKKSGSSIDFKVRSDRFELAPTMTSKWFQALDVPYSEVSKFEIAQRQVGTVEGVLGGLNSRQLNQANNIHMTYRAEDRELLLRLEMLTGVTVMGQASKCMQLMDLLRSHGILDQFAAGHSGPDPAVNAAADIPGQIAKLSGLAAQGILTQAEFEAKKAELLARM